MSALPLHPDRAAYAASYSRLMDDFEASDAFVIDSEMDIFTANYAPADVARQLNRFSVEINDALTEESQCWGSCMLSLRAENLAPSAESVGALFSRALAGEFGHAEQDALQLAIDRVATQCAEKVVQRRYPGWTLNGERDQ